MNMFANASRLTCAALALALLARFTLGDER